MPQVSSKPLNSFDRRHFIGGSDARIIMGQDEKALIRLWQEKRGEVGPEDLSANLIVQLGVVTEDLNRVWYSAFPPKCVFRFHINDMRCTGEHEKTRN
jgi:predicted phage-related endonuclease